MKTCKVWGGSQAAVRPYKSNAFVTISLSVFLVLLIFNPAFGENLSGLPLDIYLSENTPESPQTLNRMDEFLNVKETTPASTFDQKPDVNDYPSVTSSDANLEISSIEKLIRGQYPDAEVADIRQFGYDVFRKSVSSFAAIANVPVGPDYVIGPGDNFTVTMWGRANAQYSVTVNRNGEIVLPEVGVLNVSGMTFEKLKDYLQNELSRKFTDFKMSITMGRLRTIRVFVVGQTQTPGSYTLSSLSTVVNAMFTFGGPSKNGSLRQVQVSRMSAEPMIIDMYDFLLGGDKSQDIRLQDGDTIFIPLIGPVVAVTGNVKRPAIYEMNSQMTLMDVIELAGGVTFSGWLQRVQVERADSHQRRIVVDFDISDQAEMAARKQAIETVIQDGDIVKIFNILPMEENIVNLEGHVWRSGKYELKEGMRLGDILHSYEVLKPQPNLEYAYIERLVEPDMHPIRIPFQPGQLLAGDQNQNIRLQRLDTIRLFQWDERLSRTVRVSGFVYDPNRYPLSEEMRVSDLVKLAGGAKKNAFLKNAELTRYHIQQQGVVTEKIEVQLGAALAGDISHDILLKDYDHLIVRPIPELQLDRMVTISGQVRHPGSYPIRKNERLSSVIERAGGFTEDAYLRGAVFTRESAEQVQRKRLDNLIMQMEESMLSETQQRISGAYEAEEAKVQQQTMQAKKQILEKLRAAEINGRVVIKLRTPETFKNSQYDFVLEDGDHLTVPDEPAIVHVVGEVFNPTSLLYEDHKTVGYYLGKVGGITKEADRKQINLIRADGTVLSYSQKDLGQVYWEEQRNQWIFGGFEQIMLYPGDTIVVPRRIDKYLWLKNTKDITQILFQIAVAAGVVIAL